MPFRHRIVYQAHFLRPAGSDAPAGQDHIHGRHWTDEAGEADRSPEAGMDPQFHFGKAELGSGGVRGNPVTTGQRQFQPPAEAEAVNEADGRGGEQFDPAEDGLPSLDVSQGRGRIGQAGKFSDVRTGDETVRLPGAEYHAGR